MPSTDIGENIRDRRKSLGYTQKELAKILEEHPSVISLWEVGDRTPSSEKIVPLSKALCCPPSLLLGHYETFEGTILEVDVELDQAEIRAVQEYAKFINSKEGIPNNAQNN